MVIVTYHLVEKKAKTLANPKGSDDTPKTTIFIHKRSIKARGADAPFVKCESNRSYSVQETLTEGEDDPDRIVEAQIDRVQIGRCGWRQYVVTTGALSPMTQEEVEKFEEDWSNLWNPQSKLELD
jgi:hypothetical protein